MAEASRLEPAPDMSSQIAERTAAIISEAVDKDGGACVDAGAVRLMATISVRESSQADELRLPSKTPKPMFPSSYIEASDSFLDRNAF